MKGLKMLALTVGALALTQVACAGHHSIAKASGTQSNPTELSKTFSVIDPAYDVKDTSLANKIEGISLDSTGNGPIGVIDGQILLQGESAPVHYYSLGFDTTTLKADKTIDIIAQLPDQNSLGGPLSGVFKCLNADCSRTGVYFHFNKGAGFIFQKNKMGVFQLVNSVGKTVSLDKAMAKRGLTAAK